MKMSVCMSLLLYLAHKQVYTFMSYVQLISLTQIYQSILNNTQLLPNSLWSRCKGTKHCPSKMLIPCV